MSVSNIPILGWLFGGNDNENAQDLGGAGAVFEAITERTDMGYEIQIQLGEPRLIDRGNVTEDLYVVIPTSTENGPDPADLEYDLPDGIEDAEAELYNILDAFGIDKIADIGDLAGAAVPGEQVNGAPVPNFEALFEDSSDE